MPGLSAIISLVLSLYLGLLAFLVLTYVLQSVALFKLAKKRGILNYAMAWVPIGSTWLLGKLADDVNLCRRNKKTHFARNLLVIQLVYIVSLFVIYFGVLITSVSLGLGSTEPSFSPGLMAFFLVFIVLYLALVALIITLYVINYMALYRVFYGYAEENAAVFLVLSIFFSIVQPFLLFYIRNKELLPPDPSTFFQNGFPVYPNMYTPTSSVVENKIENNSNMEDNTNE